MEKERVELTEAGRKARAEYKRQWRARNKEKLREYARRYRERHKEKVKEVITRHWNKKGEELQKQEEANA